MSDPRTESATAATSDAAGIDICGLDDLTDGGATKFDIEIAGVATAVAVVRIGDDVYALADVCSHANVSLSGGDVWCDELELECPRHGSAFKLTTGEPNTLPATQPVAVFDAAIVDGRVILAAADTNTAPEGGDR